MQKRLALAAFDVFFLFAAAAACNLLPTAQAYAYVDPSVMTYTIQALAGVAVALSAVFGVLWRKARRKTMKILGIDENAGKVVDPEVHRIKPDKKSEADEAIANSEIAFIHKNGEAEPARKNPYGIAFKRRLVTAALASFLLVLTICITGPVEIVTHNQKDIILGLDSIWLTLAVLSLAFFILIMLLLSVLRGRAFAIATGIITALSVCCLVQALALNEGLPIADGREVNWDSFQSITTISTIVWLVIIAAFVFMAIRHFNIQKAVVPIVCIALIAVQTVTIIGTVAIPAPQPGGTSATNDLAASSSATSQSSDPAKQPSNSTEPPSQTQLALSAQQNPAKNVVTEDGLLTLNPKNNIVVFVLDTADSAEFTPIFNRHPEAFADFTGFTYYTDTVGYMIPTTNAVPYMLTGQFPRDNDTYTTYANEVYGRGTFLQDITNAGYSIGLYSDSIGANLGTASAAGANYNFNQIAGNTINIHPLDRSNIAAVQTFFMLCSATLYRDLAWALKPPFWYYTSDINYYMSADIRQSKNGQGTPFVVDDISLYDTIKTNRLQLTDQAQNGAFRFIHMQGMHYPYTLDENAQKIPKDQGTQEGQALGAFKIVGEYLQQMKQLGVYDSATVIITADHGRWFVSDDYLKKTTTPIMFYKPPETPERASQSLQVSKVPVSHAEYVASVIGAVGGNTSSYGRTFAQIEAAFNAAGGNGDAGSASAVSAAVNPRTFYMSLCNDKEDFIKLVEYRIEGDAQNFSNWHLTGREIDGESVNNLDLIFSRK